MLGVASEEKEEMETNEKRTKKQKRNKMKECTKEENEHPVAKNGWKNGTNVETFPISNALLGQFNCYR